MTSDDQIEFSHLLAQFLAWMLEQGYQWTMGDCWRSTDELNCNHCGKPVTYQGLLVYNKKSKTLQSKHCDRRAVDLILYKDGQPDWQADSYQPLGEKWTALGGTWGGHFTTLKDWGHFEL